ncbi:MAG: hypothetical protein K0R14_22 [Burkholderiales bacterium]|nr:hypothetical protein [Burkholderiales bacterium]
MQNTKIFRSFIQGGFECSTKRRRDGKRLDLINSTLHDMYVHEDYSNLKAHEIHTIRDGLRWHLIESRPGYYDWSSFLPMLRASISNKMQVIWDLCHYGWPDDIDIWKPEFIIRFASFAQAAARLIKSETDEIPFYSPINEISFWSWAGGDVGFFYPLENDRGFELKHQLVRATIAAIESIRLVDPRARFVQAEPLVNVISATECNIEASSYNEAQFQTCDMLSGKLWPGLGGREDILDIVGVNYYPYNQWVLHGSPINLEHPQYKPLSAMLIGIYNRYKRPLVIAETGAEGNNRLDWFRYVCDEAYKAMEMGTSLEGICLYPITDYPGWDDDRHCETGLLGHATECGIRPIYLPLAGEIKKQQHLFTRV